MGTSRKDLAYPFAIVRLERNWSAGALQWQAAVTAATRDRLDQLMTEQVALHLHDQALEGRAPSAPLSESELDLSAYRSSGHDFDVVYVEPAPLSTFALAIERALREEGISQAELARRMQVPASVVSRITDPLYFGHSSKTMRAVAEALGRRVEVRLERRRPRRDPPYVSENHA